MEKQTLNKEYVSKQIENCKARISVLQNEVQQNVGVIQHCQWMLENLELEEVSGQAEKTKNELAPQAGQ